MASASHLSLTSWCFDWGQGKVVRKGNYLDFPNASSVCTISLSASSLYLVLISSWQNSLDMGRVYYRALVHLLWVLSAFTLSDPAELSALKVPGWRTRSGKKMKWKTMVTTRTKRAPSWLRSGRGGALLAAFHKKSTFILAGLVSWVSRVDLRPSLPPSG